MNIMKIYEERFMVRRQIVYFIAILVAFMIGNNGFHKISIGLVSTIVMAVGIELVNVKIGSKEFEASSKAVGLIIFVFGLSILYIGQFKFKG